MRRLVLLRHGESIWNKEDRFTGWTDVDLSDRGVKEAIEAGRLLRRKGYSFDVAFTSVLKRAIRTVWLVLEEMDLMWIPVYHSWRLNERHYGALQGEEKAEVARRYGADQLDLWRRSYAIRPPALEPQDERFPGKDPRYARLEQKDLPLTESLEDALERAIPYWHEAIALSIMGGCRVLLAAHGNTLRALVKLLDNVSDEAIAKLDIPTGIPLVYDLDDNLKPTSSFYLGDRR